ncbi:unnamed protein product, partial [Didymodactylos carnosus]
IQNEEKRMKKVEDDTAASTGEAQKKIEEGHKQTELNIKIMKEIDEEKKYVENKENPN